MREDSIKAICNELKAKFFGARKGLLIYKKNDVKAAFKKVQSDLMRKMILDENKRSDGTHLRSGPSHRH